MPAPTPMPTFVQATLGPTIGQPADDGARIIAVDTNPPVIHCTNAGCSAPTYIPATRARDLTIDSPAVGYAPYMQRDFDRSFPLILKALGE